MILGYEMYRNMTQFKRIKNKKHKKIITETLVDPGKHWVDDHKTMFIPSYVLLFSSRALCSYFHPELCALIFIPSYVLL